MISYNQLISTKIGALTELENYSEIAIIMSGWQLLASIEFVEFTCTEMMVPGFWQQLLVPYANIHPCDPILYCDDCESPFLQKLSCSYFLIIIIMYVNIPTLSPKKQKPGISEANVLFIRWEGQLLHMSSIPFCSLTIGVSWSFNTWSTSSNVLVLLEMLKVEVS